MQNLPPLTSLRAFAALAETRSMTQAGVLLNVSHAAISQQIKSLEAHLGLTLVTRQGRSVTLTAAGARLADVVTEAFRSISAEVDALTGADADRPVQVTTTPMFAASWLMPRIADFRDRHPEIDLMLNPTTDIIPLAPGAIDLAIRYGYGTWPGLDDELLLPTHFIVVASHKLVGDRQITEPRELTGFPWLLEIGNDEAADWLTRHGVTERLSKGVTRLPGDLMLSGVRAGHGVAATRRALVEGDIASGELLPLFEEREQDAGYYLVTRPGVMRPSVKTFARWLRRQAKG